MESAHPALASSSSESTFAIKYQVFAGSAYNPDLSGAGVFTARGDGTFRFTGRRRALFSRRNEDVEFAASDVMNVVMNGNAVQFVTTRGAAGKKRKPFIFFCRNRDEAIAVARLLPAAVDTSFVETLDFEKRLQQLSPVGSHPMETITNGIIALNVIVFVVMAGGLGAGWFEVADMTAYMRYGANHGAATTDGEWWRLVTSMFMHYGIVHLLLNMWALFQSGQLVERLQGRALYAVTYLASGIGGSLLSLVWHGEKGVWSAGASGAVFGVYGAMLGFMLKEKQALPRAVFDPMLKSTLTFAGYNLIYGLVHPGIDNAAHVGGFVAGALFGWLTALPLEAEVRLRRLGQKLTVASAALAAMLILGFFSAPRFKYSIHEELRWSDALKGFGEKEKILLTRQISELTRWQKSADNGAAFVRLIEQDLTPFYRNFGQRIDSLALADGRATAERRARLAQFVRFRLEAYGHLLRAVKEKDQEELAAFQNSEAQASKVISAFNQSKK